jgi:type I restriction enzyme, S subunit
MNPDSLPETTDPGFEMEYVDIGSLSLQRGIETREAMRFGASPSRARKPIRDGDTIIATVRTYLKAIALVDETGDNWVASTGFAVCRPSPGVDPRYLYRAVQSGPFVDAVVACSTGVSYPAINPSVLGTLPIPLPDLPTQRAVADFLDRETARIDRLIEKKQRMVEVLDQRATSLTWTLVTGRDYSNSSTIDSGFEWIGRIPATWRAVRIKTVARLESGHTKSFQ